MYQTHLRGGKSGNQAWSPATRWFLDQLIFDPENGGDTFLRNIGSLRTTQRYIPEDSNIYNYRCENPKTYKVLRFLKREQVKNI
jgi:hypothetical protein